MNNWLKELTGTDKAVIAMCHLQPLPGDPYYDKEKGMEYALEAARKDLHALQDGGVDAVMFSNEFSLPYLTDCLLYTSCGNINRFCGGNGSGGKWGNRLLHQRGTGKGL